VRQTDPELLPLEDRAALVPALGDERDRRALEIVAEIGERVQVRVRAEEAGVAVAGELGEARFERLTGRADLGEAGGEDHRELRLLRHGLLEVVDHPLGSREEHREIDVAGTSAIDAYVATPRTSG